MKKILFFCLVMAVAVLFLFGIGTSAFTAPAGWYVRRNSEHKQPALDAAYRFIENYDCFYVDKRYTEESSEKVIYLTFDVGYENGNTEKILNTLKEKDVKASFFVLSHLVIDNTDLVLRMADEGHVVCNHTSKHKDMTKMHTLSDFREELSRLERVYTERTGREMAKIYRPPEGRISEENLVFLQTLGYKTVLWSFAYADWDNDRQPSAEGAMKKIMENTHNGAIFLFHPTSATNAAILGECIDRWQSEGYTFRTLDCLEK